MEGLVGVLEAGPLGAVYLKWLCWRLYDLLTGFPIVIFQLSISFWVGGSLP